MIKTEHLTKHYGSLTAVEDVSFQVGTGEVLGFLGPNAAGKTTTMRMLAGFVTPTSGRASICGHDVETEPLAAKAALGYLPEGAPTYGEMTVRRILADDTPAGLAARSRYHNAVSMQIEQPAQLAAARDAVAALPTVAQVEVR